MSRSKRVLGAAALLGTALVLALGQRTPERQRAASLPPAAVPAETPPKTQPTPPVARAAPAPSAAAPLAAPSPGMTREQKQRLAEDAEAGRIAARERKLSALDWDAPRPGPPPADAPVAVSKKEAELTLDEKLEKTARISSLLRDRARRTEQALAAAATTGQQSGAEALLLARLQSRVSELEQTAAALRGERSGAEAATGGQAPAAPAIAE
jgi:hypothetical protein